MTTEISQAWVVYSTIPETRQEGAFTEKKLADELSECLYQSKSPVLMELDKIEVEVDRFSKFLIDGLMPYTVLMVDDSLFELWGYGLEEERITRLDELTTHSNGDEVQWYKTFWANDSFEAHDQAVAFWEKLKLQLS